MARKKQQNIVRTDYLESWIGFYIAHRDREKRDALCKLARDIAVPLDWNEVERFADLHEGSLVKQLSRREKRASTPV